MDFLRILIKDGIDCESHTFQLTLPTNGQDRHRVPRDQGYMKLELSGEN